MAMKRNSDLSGSRPVVKGSQISRPSTQSTSSVSRLEGGGLVASNAQALFDKALARLEAQVLYLRPCPVDVHDSPDSLVERAIDARPTRAPARVINNDRRASQDDEGAVAHMCRRRSAQRRPLTYFLHLLLRYFSKHLQIEI